MSDLLKSARALDDDRFRWRVQAAMIVAAQAKLTENDPLALSVLSYPQQEDTRMIALVASDEVVRAGISVDGDNTVDTESVTDEAIQAAVMAAWGVLSGVVGRAETV